ncbi:MAG TPA: hypothetical protein VIE68_07475 [Gemmatimonadota bacterium]
MRIGAPLAVLLLGAVLACGQPRSESTREDSIPARDSVEGGERAVVLTTGPIHVERDEASPPVTEVAAGTLLRIVPDSAGGTDWVRVATWDDRRGWIPAPRLIGMQLWSRFAEALGGVAPVLLRAAYPVEGGRWAIEAPLGSSGFTVASTAWILADSAWSARVVRIDSIENLCGGERHRFGTTDAPAGGENFPVLEAGVLAAPSGTRPSARRLPIEALDPEPALAALADRIAGELGPPGATGPPEAVEWRSLGPDAAWAALSWRSEDPATGRAQVAAAALFRRGDAGWEHVATMAPAPSSAEIPAPAWRPVAAYSTGGAAPTLLLVEAFEYEGARLDIWIERGGGFARIHEGYYWGC